MPHHLHSREVVGPLGPGATPRNREAGDAGMLNSLLGCATTPSSTSLPATAHAALVARAFAQTQLCRLHGLPAEPEVLLAVSELTTRALWRGAERISITIECQGSHVRVSVTEGGVHAALPPLSRDMRLLLIDRVSSSWGREQRDDEHTIWCAIPTAEGSRGRAPGRRLPRRAQPPWA